MREGIDRHAHYRRNRGDCHEPASCRPRGRRRGSNCANGDTANKIGTYSLALAARHHGIPFYVAAPTTTIDPTVASGDLIPIEERSPSEVVEDSESGSPRKVSGLCTCLRCHAGSPDYRHHYERGISYPPFQFLTVSSEQEQRSR